MMSDMGRLVYLSGLLLLTACGWEQKISFTEPNGDAIGEILEPFPLNASGLRILLKEGGRQAALYDKRADVFFSFADQLAHIVAQHIRSNYSVPSEISCGDGEKQFRARYPGATAR